MSVEDKANKFLQDLPAELVSRIKKSAASENNIQFECGDITIELVDEFGDKYTKSAVRRAMAQMYGVAESTIRERERIARAVSQELRDEHPLLTYHYWRAAVNSGNMMEIVRQIEAWHEAYNAMPTVGQVFSWLRDEDVNLLWVSRLETIGSISEKVSMDDIAPERIRELCKNIKDMVEETIKDEIGRRHGVHRKDKSD